MSDASLIGGFKGTFEYYGGINTPAVAVVKGFSGMILPGDGGRCSRKGASLIKPIYGHRRAPKC